MSVSESESGGGGGEYQKILFSQCVGGTGGWVVGGGEVGGRKNK